MNATEVISSVQPQVSAGAAKSEASEGTGVFQAILANGLKQQPSENQASSQLQDLISLLSGPEAAALLAMLGVNPTVSQAGVQIQAAAGNQNLMTAAQTNPAFQLAGMQQNQILFGRGTQIMPGTLLPGNSSGSVGTAKGQLFEVLSGLLQQAGISLDEAVSQINEAMKGNSPLADAVRQLAGKAQQQASILNILGNAGMDVHAAVQEGTQNLKQMGSQLRPEMLEAELTAGTQGAGLSVPAESSSEPAASQVTVGQEAVPASGIGAALPHTKPQQVIESQPTTVHTKLSDAQFESDFPAMLVKQAALTERGGRSEMRVTLMPEGLGEIQVRIQGEGGVVSLQIAADTQHARSLLDANLGMLKLQLESQGMQVNRVEVVPSSSSVGLNMDQGMFDGRSRQGQDANPQQSNRQQATNSGTQFDDEILYQQDFGKAAGQYDWIA